MGCTSSISRRCVVGRRRKRSTVPMVAIFVPSLRVPTSVDLVRPLRGLVSRDIVDRMSALRSRVVLLAEVDTSSVVSELKHALEEYLPALLGFISKGKQLDGLVEFKWKNLEDDEQETCLASAWYELLAVMHMRAMLSLLEANMAFIPKDSSDDSESHGSEDSKKAAIVLLLKASGYLNYCINHILPRFPLQIRRRLPHDLQDGVLEATCIQALGQGIEMQLGLAIESDNATLPVKRRLACEQVSYFAQAHYCLSGCITNEAYGKKHVLFLKWKYLGAKASAYYYHGLLLGKGHEPSNHVNAAYSHFAADEFLLDSKRACLSFCLAVPVTRVPPVWGVMKHLHKKIPEVASRKSHMYGYLLDQERASQTLPDLPEFSLSLKPDDFELPDIDSSWEGEKCHPQAQSLKEHLMDVD
uniref:BRO1 domain-containing protein BROX n=1 Tax=Anthurium amnicola TaxID=1678845 RepID=A0A1D1XET3_9ARAE